MKHTYTPQRLKKALAVSFLTLSPLLGTASAQNAVVLGNATFNGGHSDGALWIQGNVYGSNYEVNQHNLSSDALYVGGDNNVSNFLRANHGIADIQGSVGKYQGAQGSISTPDWAYYELLSYEYASFGGESLDLSAPNNVTIFLENDLNVFSVDASQLSGHKTLDFTGGGTVVINVTGDLNSWGWSVNYDPNKIVWNFLDADVVNISDRSFTGSLLAANATVTQNQNIDGFLLAGSWTVNNSVELHSATLPELLLPEIPTIPEIPSIPEASVTALLGLGLLPLLRRRRTA